MVVGYDENHEPIYTHDPMVGYDSYSAGIRSFDATTCGDVASSSFQGNIYEGLYTYQYLIRPPKVIPQLAAALPEVSEDKTTYTIRLKEGVTYHRNPCFGSYPNGTYKTRTVRASDFVLAFKRCADFHNSNASLSWPLIAGKIAGLDAFRKKTQQASSGDFSRYDAPVSGITALDEHTLQITLNEPFPQIMYVLAMHLYAPCPAEAIDYWLANRDSGEGNKREAIDPEQRLSEFTKQPMVIGTGPYVLQKWERKRRIVLARNPDFRYDTYPTLGMPDDVASGLLKDAGKQVPFIDAYQWDFVAETFANWMRFLSCQTGANGIPREQYDSVVQPGKKLAAQWKARGIFLVTYTSPTIFQLGMNMQDKVMGQSKSLRQALNLSFDVQTRIDLLYNGRGEVARNIIPSEFPAFKAAGPGPYFKFDLAEAKRKIKLAKQELGAKGLLDAKGNIPELTLDYGFSGEPARREAEYVQQQFAKIGVRIKPIYNDWPTMQEKMKNGTTQLFSSGWHADYMDAENFLQLYYSPNIASGTNSTGYTNVAFDTLYEEARVMSPSPERMKKYVQMLHMLCEDAPVIVLSEPMNYVLYAGWNLNVKKHPVGYGYLKYRRIDIAERIKRGGPK